MRHDLKAASRKWKRKAACCIFVTLQKDHRTIMTCFRKTFNTDGTVSIPALSRTHSSSYRRSNQMLWSWAVTPFSVPITATVTILNKINEQNRSYTLHTPLTRHTLILFSAVSCTLDVTWLDVFLTVQHELTIQVVPGGMCNTSGECSLC